MGRPTLELRPQALACLRSTVVREAALVAALTVLVAVASVLLDLPGRIADWSRSTVGPLDDAVLLLVASHLFMIVFGGAAPGTSRPSTPGARRRSGSYASAPAPMR